MFSKHTEGKFYVLQAHRRKVLVFRKEGELIKIPITNFSSGSMLLHFEPFFSKLLLFKGHRK